MFQASHDKSVDGPLDETTVDVSPTGETELIELVMAFFSGMPFRVSCLTGLQWGKKLLTIVGRKNMH